MKENCHFFLFPTVSDVVSATLASVCRRSGPLVKRGGTSRPALHLIISQLKMIFPGFYKRNQTTCHLEPTDPFYRNAHAADTQGDVTEIKVEIQQCLIIGRSNCIFSHTEMNHFQMVLDLFPVAVGS